MKRLLIFLTLLTLPGVVHAGDPTTDMLEAPFVTDAIALSTSPASKPVVLYTIDSGISPKEANGLTFRSNGQINILIHNFNPLTQSWTVEAKATPDVSFTAIQAFLADLKSLQGSLPQAPVPSAALAAPGAQRKSLAERCPIQGDDCALINCKTKEAYTYLNARELTPSAFKDLATNANGQKMITGASKSLISTQTQIDNDVKNAQDDLAEIRAAYSALQSQPSLNCRIVTGQILVDYVEVRSTADRIIAAKEALSQQLGELVKTLQPFLDESVWQRPDLTDYMIKKVTPTFADQQSLTVTAKVRTVTLKDDNTIAVTTDDANAVTAAFVVRKNSFFVAERAAAMIYNNLKYPQYGTAKNGSGATVVQRTADHQPINGALMLNLVMRFGSPSVAYPFLQLGVSSAKDFPGFLAGVGLRFVAPFNFSLSAGGMITRFKDLDGNLKVGDTVTGTDDINKHLAYKTSPVVLYGAMQLKF